MSIAVSEALDYSPKEISAGTYVFRTVNPENGQPTGVSRDSTYNTDFLLPNQVFNLSRSYLNFNVTLNDTTAADDGRWNQAHNGFLAPIDGLTLSTADNVKLVEMNNLPEYTKMVWRPETDLQEFLSFPCHSNSEVAVANVTEPGHLFHRIRAANSIADAASYRASSYHSSNENGTALAAAADGYTAVANYISSAAVMDHAAGGALAYRVQLPLKLIYGSLFAVDKDLYFGQQLRLTVRWNQGSKFGARLGANANLATAAPLASADLNEAPSVTNVALRIAVETNEAVAAGIRTRVMTQGININVPFTHSWKAVSSGVAGSSDTVIRKFNRNHGAKLLRVICAIFGTKNTGKDYCSAYNVTSTKWSGYRTFLDSKPIPDDTLLMNDFSAYQYVAEKLKGSVLKDFKDWAAVPALIEDFSGVPHTKDYVKSDTMNSGLDLSTEREFALQFTNVPATVQPVFIWAVCQKQLTITAQGTSLM